MKAIIKVVPISLISAAAGVSGTIFISWHYGLDAFAEYTISLAKISIALICLELIPASYSAFKQQDDICFSKSIPGFYLLSTVFVVALSFAFIQSGWIKDGSMLMVIYALLMVFQRYLDGFSQAHGLVGCYLFSIFISNFVRLLFLVAQAFLIGAGECEQLWTALLAGTLFGQVYLFCKLPGSFCLLLSPKLSGFSYLYSLRNDYKEYYLNSFLKRVKDTSTPLFCDYFVNNKSEAGAFFLCFKAVDFACGQIRLIEAFLTNKRTRARVLQNRKSVIIVSAILAQGLVVFITTAFVGLGDVGINGLLLGSLASFYVYPYMYEIFGRSDSYANFEPKRVTRSLLAYLFGVALVLMGFGYFEIADAVILVVSILMGQIFAALSYSSFKGRDHFVHG